MPHRPNGLRVAIIGAGALGGYIAAELCVGGAEVVVIGDRGREPRRIRAMRADGSEVITPHVLTTVSSVERLHTVDAVVVAVKSRHTLEVARELAAELHPNTPVLTLQNGLTNRSTLASRLGPRVTRGVVTYNVFIDAEGRHVQATRGKVILERPPKGSPTMLELAWSLERGGDRIDLRRHMDGAVAGKLLLNLQNGVSAATGLCLAELLEDRDARLCFAACVEEGLHVMRAIGMKPTRVIAVPPALLPAALRMPDDLVSFAVAHALAIRRGAHSSMLQDIKRGVPTEIEELNGAIVQLARSHGLSAPNNAIVANAVRELEAKSDAALHAPFLSSQELRQRMESPPRRVRLAETIA